MAWVIFTMHMGVNEGSCSRFNVSLNEYSITQRSIIVQLQTVTRLKTNRGDVGHVHLMSCHIALYVDARPLRDESSQ